jgi:hypothetical protein
MGNKIQLPKVFGGCDSVETDSPIEHHPGKTGENECPSFGVGISIVVVDSNPPIPIPGPAPSTNIFIVDVRFL